MIAMRFCINEASSFELTSNADSNMSKDGCPGQVSQVGKVEEVS